jgi:PAS domain S-box-containing protein
MDPTVDLHGIGDIEYGTHLCCLYGSEEDHRALLTPFLRGGLERGEKVLYIRDANATGIHLEYLLSVGVATEPFLFRGQVEFLDSREAFLRDGIFDPAKMAALLRKAIGGALENGYPGVRVTCEMSWALAREAGSGRLAEFEANLNQLFPVQRAVVLCQYDTRRFPPETLLDALETHPVVSRGNDLCDNFYYVPPETRFGPERLERSLNRKLVNLKERGKLEAARKKSEKEQQIFMSLVENSTDLIGIASLDGKVFYLNPAGRKLVGLDGPEAAGKTRIRDYSREEDIPRLQKMVGSLQKKGTWRGEARIRHFKTGMPVPVEMHAFVIRDAKTGQPIAVATINRDISVRKKMEEDMARSEKLDSIGVLAGGIAHDFNNLLTAIFGNITLAKMYANRQSDVYKRLEESEKAAERARDLTQQLLTFSKGGAPVKKTIALQELGKESANFVLRGSNVKCEFSFPADLWHVEADEGQISQVLNNIIINANHAMSEGGTVQMYCGNVVVDQSDPLLAKGKYILISIMDHGTGITKEHLSKIFDPYFTTKKKGSGLGLSTSYSIVRSHGGHITVESFPGIGTTFKIYLPASGEGKPADCAGEARFVTGKGRILVMDDEEAVRDVAQGMLETLGYSVTLAKDGTEAIEIYKVAMASGAPFDSVLMDLTIPGGMGGMEAVKRILEIDSEAKAIVCSGYSNDTIMANYNSYGFRAVVPKPYSLKQLGSAISDVLSTLS